MEVTLLRPDPHNVDQNQLAPQPVAHAWIARAICFGRGPLEDLIQRLLWDNRPFVVTPLPDDVWEVSLPAENGPPCHLTPEPPSRENCLSQALRDIISMVESTHCTAEARENPIRQVAQAALDDGPCSR